MRRRSLGVLLAVGMLVLASVSGASAASGGSDRPWTGHASGQTWFDLANPKGCDAGITTMATEPARSSHLGAAYIITSHCPTGDPSDNFTDSDLTLYAANGDALFGTYVGTIDEFSGVLGEKLHFTLHLTVTGGEGRFEDATGHATMHGYAVFEGYDDYSWAWGLSWNGTLDY